MTQLGEAFDPNSVEAGGFEPFAAGQYIAQIVEGEIADTKSGTGKMLKFTWEIADGQFAGRKVFQNINYVNASTQAELIGRQQLKAICEALGIAGHLEDTDQLKYQPCLVRVAIEDKNDGYAPKNIIKGVKGLAAAPVAANDNVKGTPRPAANDNARPVSTPRVAATTATPPVAATTTTARSAAVPARPWR